MNDARRIREISEVLVDGVPEPSRAEGFNPLSDRGRQDGRGCAQPDLASVLRTGQGTFQQEGVDGIHAPQVNRQLEGYLVGQCHGQENVLLLRRIVSDQAEDPFGHPFGQTQFAREDPHAVAQLDQILKGSVP